MGKGLDVFLSVETTNTLLMIDLLLSVFFWQFEKLAGCQNKRTCIASSKVGGGGGGQEGGSPGE